MSHTALRRIAIRLLHDPAFAARLAADPSATLANEDLSDDERAWLRAVPGAAWRTDPDRPRRVLAALSEEYAASVALAPARSSTFFGSPHFHRAVQDRGSLAIAFGRHMTEAGDPRVVAVARLELAVATVRRAPRRVPSSAPGLLRLAPHACLVRVPGGTDDLLAASRAGQPPGPIATDDQPLLAVRSADTLEVTLERLEDGVARVLERAGTPVSRGDLEAIVVALGGGPEEASALIDGLVSDGVLA